MGRSKSRVLQMSKFQGCWRQRRPIWNDPEPPWRCPEFPYSLSTSILGPLIVVLRRRDNSRWNNLNVVVVPQLQNIPDSKYCNNLGSCTEVNGRNASRIEPNGTFRWNIIWFFHCSLVLCKPCIMKDEKGSREDLRVVTTFYVSHRLSMTVESFEEVFSSCCCDF